MSSVPIEPLLLAKAAPTDLFTQVSRAKDAHSDDFKDHLRDANKVTDSKPSESKTDSASESRNDKVTEKEAIADRQADDIDSNESNEIGADTSAAGQKHEEGHTNNSDSGDTPVESTAENNAEGETDEPTGDEVDVSQASESPTVAVETAEEVVVAGTVQVESDEESTDDNDPHSSELTSKATGQPETTAETPQQSSNTVPNEAASGEEKPHILPANEEATSPQSSPTTQQGKSDKATPTTGELIPEGDSQADQPTSGATSGLPATEQATTSNTTSDNTAGSTEGTAGVIKGELSNGTGDTSSEGEGRKQDPSTRSSQQTTATDAPLETQETKVPDGKSAIAEAVEIEANAASGAEKVASTPVTAEGSRGEEILSTLGKLQQSAGRATAAAKEGGQSNQPRVDGARFVGRVARAFQIAQDRGGTIQLRLSPPELGSLKLQVTVEQGALSATIEAETDAARNALLENLPALRARLAEQDIRIEKFDVDVRDEGGNEPQEFETGQRREQGESSTPRDPNFGNRQIEEPIHVPIDVTEITAGENNINLLI